ncbi:hypothetical protein D3C72_2485300 [compost metagenome]
MRLPVAVRDPQIAPVRAGGVIAVFHQIPGGIDAACAEIDGHHDVAARHFCPFGKFIRSALVRLGGPPG